MFPANSAPALTVRYRQGKNAVFHFGNNQKITINFSDDKLCFVEIEWTDNGGNENSIMLGRHMFTKITRWRLRYMVERAERMIEKQDRADDIKEARRALQHLHNKNQP